MSPNNFQTNLTRNAAAVWMTPHNYVLCESNLFQYSLFTCQHNCEPGGLLANTWGHFSPLFLPTVILLSTIYLSSSSSSSCSLFILLLFLLLPPTWVWHLPALLPLQGTTKVQGLHQGPEQTQRQEGGEWGGRDNKRKELGRRGERWGFDRDGCVKYWTKLRYLFVLNQQKCVI